MYKIFKKVIITVQLFDTCIQWYVLSNQLMSMTTFVFLCSLIYVTTHYIVLACVID